METVDVITKTTYIFFIYLLMAVFVERSVEVFISVFNYFDLKRKRHWIWNRRAEKYRDKFDRLYNFDSSNRSNKMFNWLLWGIVAEPAYNGGKLIISAQTIKTRHIQIISRAFAFLVSIALVSILYYIYQITFVDAALKVMPKSPLLSFFEHHIALNILVTSLAVAAGVTPLHNLIARVEKVGKKNDQT